MRLTESRIVIRSIAVLPAIPTHELAKRDMVMKMKRRAAILLPILAMLGGCGGGGGEGVSSAPPPPSYTALANATSSTPLATQAARYEFVSLHNVPIPTNSGQFASIEISYDPSSQVYHVRGVPSSGSTTIIDQSFGPSDVSADGAGSYARITTTADRTEVAKLAAGPTTGFTYASFGRWTTGLTEGGDQRFDTIYFSYGVRTLPQDMPKTGQASYRLGLSGDGGGAPISGTGAITADFAAGTIGASLAPTQIYSPLRISYFANLSGTGTIDSAHSSFAASVTGDGYSGSLSGTFYGPQAAELGGAFTLSAPNGSITAVGVFSGRKN